MESKTFHTVDYSDLQEFIRNEFGRPDYSLPADIECSNDSSHTFSVGSDEWHLLDEYDIERVEEFKIGKHVDYITGPLLQHLYEMGQIPAGEYLVLVSW